MRLLSRSWSLYINASFDTEHDDRSARTTRFADHDQRPTRRTHPVVASRNRRVRRSSPFANARPRNTRSSFSETKRAPCHRSRLGRPVQPIKVSSRADNHENSYHRPYLSLRRANVRSRERQVRFHSSYFAREITRDAREERREGRRNFALIDV